MRDYLTHLAVRQHVSASTQNQALAAILLLCRDVLGVQVEGLANAVKAKRGSRLPVVLSVPEVAALLGAMRGTTWLMAALIYGGGLRVTEASELRVKDIDIRQIQDYLGHAHVETTMIYTHVVKELRTPPRSPLDLLAGRR